MRRWLLCAALAACAPGVTPAPEPRLVVETTTPAGADASAPDPRVRYPDGSRVVRRDLSRPGDAPIALSSGLAAAGGAAVRFDAGRIAFVAKEQPDDRFAVWTCDPDGSGRVKSVEDAADCGSVAFLPDGRLVYSAGSASSWALYVTVAKDAAPQRITFSGGADTDPHLLPDGRILYSSRAADGGEFARFTVHVDGTGIAPFDFEHAEPADDPATAQTALAPRARPQGHLSVVDPTKTFGDVFCVDARPDGSSNARRARFTSTSGLGRVLGDVPLESDGSLFVRVPADVPIVLDLLDADGAVVAGQHTPFWVRPGETRGCVGCHEDPDTTPPNVRPRAVCEPPVPLGAFRPAEGVR